MFAQGFALVSGRAQERDEFVDEPLVNTYFETLADLDKIVADRCVALTHQQDIIRASTLFHWWPRLHAKK